MNPTLLSLHPIIPGRAITFRYVETLDSRCPTGHLLFASTRPLPGDVSFQSEEWMFGRERAVVDPAGQYAREDVVDCLEAHAKLLVPLTDGVVEEWKAQQAETRPLVYADNIGKSDTWWRKAFLQMAGTQDYLVPEEGVQANASPSKSGFTALDLMSGSMHTFADKLEQVGHTVREMGEGGNLSTTGYNLRLLVKEKLDNGASFVPVPWTVVDK